MVTICRVTAGQNRNCYSSRPRGSSSVVAALASDVVRKLWYHILVVKRTDSF